MEHVRPPSLDGGRAHHQHIFSIFALMGSFCTCLCIGFISRSSSDGFSIFLFCVVVAHCREKPHVKTVASSVTRRLTPFARCHFMIFLLPASRASPWHGGPFKSDKSLFRQYRKGKGGGVLFSNQTMWTPPNPFNSLTFCPFFSPPSALSSSFFAYSLSAGKLSSQSPCGRRVGCGRGEVAGIMTEAGWRGAENKVALIRICQEQCAHKAAWESNLVLAVSLSDISAISRHRSECETSTLSDFLKSHQWKHKRMSVLEVKKKKKAFRPHKWTASLYAPANKCQPSLASFVLFMSAAHSGFKWIFLLYISLQGWLWAVLVLLEPLCNSIVLNVAFGCTTKNGSMLGGETVGMSLVFLTRAIRH